jgi:hypothetical protein
MEVFEIFSFCLEKLVGNYKTFLIFFSVPKIKKGYETIFKIVFFFKRSTLRFFRLSNKAQRRRRSMHSIPSFSRCTVSTRPTLLGTTRKENKIA